jgi:polysaccharide biosynthesis protein PslH
MKRRLKILFLSRWFPYPIDNGSKIRVFNLIDHLSQRHDVDLISFSTEPVSESARGMMQQYCRTVEHVPYQPFRPRALRAMLGYFSPKPRSVRETFSAEMAGLVKRFASENRYDAVIASQMDMAPYALLVKGTARILEEIELTTLYEQQHHSSHPIEKRRYSFMWWKWNKYLGSLLLGFEGATVVSELERKRVLSIAPQNVPVRVVPNGVAVSAMLQDFGKPERGRLVFSGPLSYGPNLQGMQYFLGEIYPLVQAQYPSVHLSITGRQDEELIAGLPQRDGVVFTGFLDDIRPTVAQSWGAVVPLLTGGGTRLKVLEALALGVPVVSTAKGVEGLDLIPGKEYLLGDDASQFARAVLHLLKDSELRRQLSSAGRRAVQASYDWAKIGPCFCDFVEETAAKKREKVNVNFTECS